MTLEQLRFNSEGYALTSAGYAEICPNCQSARRGSQHLCDWDSPAKLAKPLPSILQALEDLDIMEGYKE